METMAQQASDVSISRGRGRGRGRVHALHNDTSSTAHDTNGKSFHHRSTHHHDIRNFEDATGKEKTRIRTVSSSTDHEKNHSSDKENSCSPKPQRSRRSNFDTGVMSRINSHLRQGINERSDAGATHSLDRHKKESSPTSEKTGRGSPNLRLAIPPNTMSGVQFAAMLRKQMAAGERPRSMTDPTPTSPASDAQHNEAPASDEFAANGALSHQPSSGSTSSATPVSRLKGRGRARGRARSRQADMDQASAPGRQRDLHGDPSDLQTMSGVSDQFVDVQRDEAGNCSPSDQSHASHGVESKETKDSAGFSDAVADNHASSFPCEDSSKESESHCDKSGDKVSESLKNLTLKIDVNCTEPQVEELCSPDDITQLLSPNHEYTLDWAAAMETPTPDTSSDSPPDWTVRE